MESLLPEDEEEDRIIYIRGKDKKWVRVPSSALFLANQDLSLPTPSSTKSKSTNQKEDKEMMMEAAPRDITGSSDNSTPSQENKQMMVVTAEPHAPSASGSSRCECGRQF